MNAIQINGTEETPTVELNSETGKYEIKGRSFPEDVVAYYEPIIRWFTELGNSDPSGDLTFDLKLEYFNTASSKMILEVLNTLEMLKTKGRNVQINWYYLNSDEDMMEAGEEYAELVDLPFNM